MASRIITGTIYHPVTNSAWSGAIVQFVHRGLFSVGDVTYLPEATTATTDSSGDFSVTLAVPASGTTCYDIVLPGLGRQTVYLGAGADTDLVTLLASATSSVSQSAIQSAIDAHDAATDPHPGYIREGSWSGTDSAAVAYDARAIVSEGPIIAGRNVHYDANSRPAVIIADMRTQAGGNPGGNQTYPRDGVFIYSDTFNNSPLISMHITRTHNIWYISCEPHSYQFQYQHNDPVSPDVDGTYQWYTSSTKNVAPDALRYQISAGVAAELSKFYIVARAHIRKWSGQADTTNLLEACAFDGSVYSRISANGHLITKKNSAPADSELAAGEMALWFDPTNGAAKLMIKAKTADGTVRTGSVSLT